MVALAWCVMVGKDWGHGGEDGHIRRMDVRDTQVFGSIPQRLGGPVIMGQSQSQKELRHAQVDKTIHRSSVFGVTGASAKTKL